MYFQFIVTIAVFWIIPIKLWSQQTGVTNTAFQFEASYTGDNINNISGGIKAGASYLGLAQMVMEFNTEQAGLWKGGNITIHGANTHGATPSADLIGDYQIVSNIEAGNHTYIQELYYDQVFGRFEITLGVQNLNNDFACSDEASIYLNSSFGIVSTLSGNFPSPIFPLTSLGATVRLKMSDKSRLQAAVYDGTPLDFENNPYNLHWELKKEDGILIVSEFQYLKEGKNKGLYKFGSYVRHLHSNLGHQETSLTEPLSFYKNTYGFYMNADQTLWQINGEKKLGLFLQLALSPQKINFNRTYLGLGLNFCGLLKKNSEDILGFAVAHAGIRETGNETTFELTYHLPVTGILYIQPDLQYVINPSGYYARLENSLVAGFRFGFSFGT